ncbi:MAG: leucine-rich repeat domain-containing protein [Clostridia bacterium]|nr:leucine-rich repeat domain-containing protein [Clostridia bacterium]
MASDVNIIKSKSEYTRLYQNMRGVDFGAAYPEDSEKRFGYLENMYIDYDGTSGALESIPGYRSVYNFDGRINGIFSQSTGGEEYLIIHAGTALYRFNVKDRDSITSLSPIRSDLSDTKSTSFTFGEGLYILDGKKIFLVNSAGKVYAAGEIGYTAYVPTTYIDGVPNEARNLLTSLTKQVFTIKSADELSYGTPGLTYTITDYDSATCSVSGARSSVSGQLHIPSYTVIGGRKYKVTEIADCAFQNDVGITYLYTNSNLVRIGHKAFSGCSAMTGAVLSRTVRTISTFAFENCSSLAYFHIGDCFERFGDGSFDFCTSLKTINYAKTEDDFQSIQNTIVFEDRSVNFNVPYTYAKLCIPLMGSVEKVSGVSINDTVTGWRFAFADNTITIDCYNRELFEGRRITVKCKMTDDDGLLCSKISGKTTPYAAVSECTVAHIFDGRVFLSGNPSLPGIIFYTGNNENGSVSPSYIGADSYIFDGVDGYPVTSITSTKETLIVMKGGDDGAGSIFAHKREVGYPVTYVHKGASCLGESALFSGDVFFTAPDGIFSIKETNGTTEGPYRESECISPLLSEELLRDASFTEWCGYLAVLVNGKIFLADSRGRYTKNSRRLYEWYYLSGIGAYENDLRVYRYSSLARDGYEISHLKGQTVKETVMSVGDGNGGLIYYVADGDRKISVYPTEERVGGDFYPAKKILSVGKLLFFGTDSGNISIFNNDKRGAPPESLSCASGFDSGEYERTMGGRIHPRFYSFASHAVSYVISTTSDGCIASYLEKSSIRSSLTVKFRSLSDADITCLIKTDTGGTKAVGSISTGRLDFSSLDFHSLNLRASESASAALDEWERCWLEKQITLKAFGAFCPIGIYSIAYRYKIKGKLQNK